VSAPPLKPLRGLVAQRDLNSLRIRRWLASGGASQSVEVNLLSTISAGPTPDRSSMLSVSSGTA
jgi:hypothetical protein